MRLRTLATLIALVMTVLSGAACSNEDDAAAASDSAKADLAERAAQITDQMAANDWAAVREDFDDVMLDQLSEEALAANWSQLTAQVGAFQSRGEPSEVPKDERFVVYDTPMTFERSAMKSRVTFNDDGKVSGVFVLQADVE